MEGSNKNINEVILNGLRESENTNESPVITIRNEYLEFIRNALQRVALNYYKIPNSFDIVKAVQQELEK